jgi:hypothetical protein
MAPADRQLPSGAFTIIRHILKIQRLTAEIALLAASTWLKPPQSPTSAVRTSRSSHERPTSICSDQIRFQASAGGRPLVAAKALHRFERGRA